MHAMAVGPCCVDFASSAENIIFLFGLIFQSTARKSQTDAIRDEEYI